MGQRLGKMAMSDQKNRAEAVELQRSVIVQAPAGSGKTSLLVERYLGLLAAVDAPEEILAITFTRKAATEMQQRVLQYLDPAYFSDEEHEQAPLIKARAVQDKVAAWRLMENPHRLLIRTIDSFNHYLARTMPVASALGPVPTPADNSKALYRQAARNVLAQIEGQDEIVRDLYRLLEWRDHRSQDIEDILASLLGKRDQWLRAFSVTGKPQRVQLESVLSTVVKNQLEQVVSAMNDALGDIGYNSENLATLLKFAATTLETNNRASPIRALVDMNTLPDETPESLPLWAGLAEALLTRDKKGQFRKTVTIATGFPPKTDEKRQFQDLLDSLADNEELCDKLNRARHLPEPRYEDGEWEVLDSLVRVLNRTAAELELVFAHSGQTDHTGLAAAALRGLGDEETGFSDLGLYLDRRIRHLLMDEFQDTNWAQLHLLEKLTTGWESGDGRSLFLVGDPMQSIYRFREAEVGLFIRSRDQGVGALRLESKRLTRNFRSREEIVDWVNIRLGPVFPHVEDISAGAVAYAASEAGRESGGKVDILANTSDGAEAERIAELLERVIAEHASDPAFKAAIIVRSRSHLKEILPSLTRRSVAYRAVKLDPLIERPVVQDLLALTRAIVQPADTTAVLSLLRSPVCGLTLTNLHALAGDGRELHGTDALNRLDSQSRQRAERVFEVLDNTHKLWRRLPIRDLVEGAWHRMGGPGCCINPENDLRDASIYLDALDRAAANGLLEDWNDFIELLDGEYTEGDPPSETVKLEILTMHGAKGLEWDFVVLPGLNKRPGGRDTTLLHWLPFTTSNQQEQILLAPLRAAEDANDSPLIELIRREQKTRAAYENQRLLYVACTRARVHLVLSACLDPEKDEVKPASGSLLADIWPTTGEDFLAALAESHSDTCTVPCETTPDQTLRRIDVLWHPQQMERLHWNPALLPPDKEVDIEYNWAGVQARRTGTVLHRLLETVGNIGIEDLGNTQRTHLIGRIPSLLKAMGARGDELEDAAKIIRAAFEQTLDNKTGQWILSNRHLEATCELPIAGLINGHLVNAVVDRTFVDENDVRWIIDYKSGYHAGSDLETFLSREQERYRKQLGRYRLLFKQLEKRAAKTALYLPRHDRLQIIQEPVRE